MSAKIIIEVTEREDSGQCEIKTEIEGSNKYIIEGLVEALAQVESRVNKADKTLLKLYTNYRLKCIREEYDNEN